MDPIPAISALYAAAAAAGLLILSARVIALRRAGHVAIGDGGDPLLRRAIRAHGNFTEYVPLALLLTTLAELCGSPAWALHAIGACLVVGRAAHAWGIVREPEAPKWRVFGMALTFAAIAAGAAACVAAAAGT